MDRRSRRVAYGNPCRLDRPIRVFEIWLRRSNVARTGGDIRSIIARQHHRQNRPHHDSAADGGPLDNPVPGTVIWWTGRIRRIGLLLILRQLRALHVLLMDDDEGRDRT
jgi:hypothetical protein